MRSSLYGRKYVALPSEVWSRQTKPGLPSATALSSSSRAMNPAMRASSRGALMRPMLTCARWYFMLSFLLWLITVRRFFYKFDSTLFHSFCSNLMPAPANAPSCLRRENQALRAFANVRRESTRLSGGGVKVNAQKSGTSCKLAGLIVRHLVHKADRFLFHFQYSRTNADEIACTQFTLVFNMLLHCGHSGPFAGEAGPRQAKAQEKLPCSFIEFSHIPHYVHVAHMIAVPRINGATISNDRLRHF